jgi:hypothetical protein
MPVPAAHPTFCLGRSGDEDRRYCGKEVSSKEISTSSRRVQRAFCSPKKLWLVRGIPHVLTEKEVAAFQTNSTSQQFHKIDETQI